MNNLEETIRLAIQEFNSSGTQEIHNYTLNISAIRKLRYTMERLAIIEEIQLLKNVIPELRQTQTIRCQINKLEERIRTLNILLKTEKDRFITFKQ